MKTAIDSVGRLAIPKRLRDEVGLAPGSQVELSVDGAGLRVEPVSVGGFEREGGFLVIPASGMTLSAEDVRGLRLGHQG